MVRSNWRSKTWGDKCRTRSKKQTLQQIRALKQRRAIDGKNRDGDPQTLKKESVNVLKTRLSLKKKTILV